MSAGRKAVVALMGLGIAGLLSWAFIEGREEMKREREREAPIKVPPRLGRTSRGEPVLMLDEEGRRLAALETTPARGVGNLVAVPRDALLRHEGHAWVYIEVESGRYARHEVELAEPADGSWLLRGGVHAGDRVVSVGAQALLSEELKTAIQIGEEGER